MDVRDHDYPALARRVAERRAISDHRRKRLPRTTTVRERVRRAVRAWHMLVLDARYTVSHQRTWVEAGNVELPPPPERERRKWFVRGYVEACERLKLRGRA